MAHTTRSGNTYTDKEWAEKQLQFKVQDANNDKIQRMLKWAEVQMNSKGLNGKYLATQMVFIDEMLEQGRIKCSKETAIWLNDLAERYLVACDKLENVSPIG